MWIRCVVLLSAVLAGCESFKVEKLFADFENLEVREVRRDLDCRSAQEDSSALLFPDAQAASAWAQSRGLSWNAPESLPNFPYAVVEMGRRPSGGYGLAVSRSAVLRGGLIILTATFIAPAEGRMVTQAITGPCVLVQLPPGRYTTIEVQDQAGSVRASGSMVEPGAS